MNEINTNTITVGKNLTSIFSYLNLSNKMGADEIGISYNTLSNIKNGNFPISAATMEKIEAFLTKHNLDVNLLYKENVPVRNFRLRIQKPLSGNEKSALRNTVAKLEKLFVTIDTLENEKNFRLFGYFDIYTWPYAHISLFDISQRLPEFIKIIRKKTKSPHQWALYFLHPTDEKFWGNLYSNYWKNFPIKYLVECLGIRIHYMSFGTEKLESCSTSIMDNEARTPNVLWAKPSIIINTDVCNTDEKCRRALAKEFYHMISDYEEYDILSCTDFKLESPEKDKDAETFAKELLLLECVLRDEKFFVCAILAAYEKNLLTKSECAEYLDCTEEELDDKKKAHIYSIKAILDEN